ncbi:MAG TPA: hypothetical protein VGL29_14540 [Blastocatellia bacterium]|jgi:hypothetical protein
MPGKRRSRSTRIPKARRLRTSALSRKDVTRAEYNDIINILNQRNDILNAHRDAITELQHASEIQLKRIAQIQADLDDIKRAWTKVRMLA